MTWVFANKRTIAIALIATGAVLLLLGIVFFAVDIEIGQQTEGALNMKSILELIEAAESDMAGNSELQRWGARTGLQMMINEYAKEYPENAFWIKLAFALAPYVPYKMLFVVLGVLLGSTGFMMLTGRLDERVFNKYDYAGRTGESSPATRSFSFASLFRFERKPPPRHASGRSARIRTDMPPAPTRQPTPPPTVPTTTHKTMPKASYPEAPPVSVPLAVSACPICGREYSTTFVRCPHCAFITSSKPGETSVHTPLEIEPPAGMKKASDL